MNINVSDTTVTQLLVKLGIEQMGKNPIERRKNLEENVQRLADHDKLRFLRKNNNMTQDKMGELLGVHFTSISLYESGARPLPKKAIAYIREHFPQKEEA